MSTAEIIQDVLRRETGGREWDDVRAARQAADRGGWTRGGITAAAWGLFASLGRPATADELNALSEAEAYTFYLRRYVDPYLTVPEPLRGLLVDWAVTSGHAPPVKALQIAYQERGLYHGRIDGVFGPLTLRATIGDLNRTATLYRVLDARIQHMMRLGFDAPVRAFLRAHPTSQLVNLRGWINRCLEFL